jgi:hypothetical protein
METSHQLDAALIEPSGGQCEGVDEHAVLLVVWFVGRVEAPERPYVILDDGFEPRS